MCVYVVCVRVWKVWNKARFGEKRRLQHLRYSRKDHPRQKVSKNKEPEAHSGGGGGDKL